MGGTELENYYAFLHNPMEVKWQEIKQNLVRSLIRYFLSDEIKKDEMLEKFNTRMTDD
jgi:hypothetical protein